MDLSSNVLRVHVFHLPIVERLASCLLLNSIVEIRRQDGTPLLGASAMNAQAIVY